MSAPTPTIDHMDHLRRCASERAAFDARRCDRMGAALYSSIAASWARRIADARAAQVSA